MLEWFVGIAGAVSVATIIGMGKYIASKIKVMDEVTILVREVTRQLDGTVQASALEPRLAELEAKARDANRRSIDIADRLSRLEGKIG